MAQYKHLPIYKSCYQLLIEIHIAIKDFPREYKFSLGEKLREEAIDMIILVFKANGSKRKKEYIEEIISKAQVIELITILSHDLRIMPVKRLAVLGDLINSIGKQASGWLKRNGNGMPEPENVMRFQGERSPLD